MSNEAAAPIPIYIDDKEFLLSPLTDEDIGALSMWMRSRHIHVATLAAEGLPKAAGDRLIDRAMMQASSMDIMSHTGAMLIATPDGVARLMFQALRRFHPEVTYQQCQKWMLDPKSLAEVNRGFKMVHGLKASTPDKANGKPKSKNLQRRKSTKRS